MKTNYFVIIFTAVLFSCSVNEDNAIDEINTVLENETSVPEETTSSYSSENSSSYTENSSINAIASFLRTRGSAQNNSHGINVFYSPESIDYAFDMEGGRTLVVIVPAGDGKVTAMPNGRYKFKAHSNGPICYIINRYYEIEYSNYCMENRQGVFNFNVISDAITSTGSSGATVYQATQPYFSASVVNYVTKLNNSSVELDDDNNPVSCGDASEEINVQLKKLEGNQNQDREMKYRLTIR